MADTKRLSNPRSDPDTAVVTIRDFRGMACNLDPHDIPAGMSVSQINVGVGPAGELRVRLGAQPLRFQ